MDEAGEYQINNVDAVSIKAQIVQLMIALPDSLQVQIGESISLIAESEFPELWPELLDQLVESLNQNDFNVIKGVLRVAHSIFKRWRPATPSDQLYTEINMVLGKFAAPFLQLLQRVDTAIGEHVNDKNALTSLFENLQLLVKIYYDLNCQDIPEFFEDHLADGMNIMHKYLTFNSPLLVDADDDEEVDAITAVKTQICDLIHLYATRYGEEFAKFIPTFIQTVWDLLKQTGAQNKYDILCHYERI
ncbi:unnamed protein product [Ambrosiozyma monospora]|uniref:Unnamed protein product n=1 Tax=Ambrosiozyma monospora TaxID=43982 RepID=A0A9W6SUG4_AMBMO|nr:unnamed protein product [Ambrosiozyma monospora]